MSELPPKEALCDYIDIRDKFSYTVFILPSLKADVSLVMYNSIMKRIKPSYGAALSAAAFLVKYRGLPLDEIDVDVDGEVIKVVFSEKNDKFSVTLPKCKQLLEKSRVFAGNIEKTITLVSFKNIDTSIAIIDASDIDAISSDTLSLIYTSTPEADIAAALEVDDEEWKITAESPNGEPDSVLISCAAAFYKHGKRKTVDFCKNGEKLTLTLTYQGLKATLSPPRIMRFDTPYL